MLVLSVAGGHLGFLVREGEWVEKRPDGMTMVPGSRESIWCGMPHATLFVSHTAEEQPQSQEELLHMQKKTRPRSMHT